MDLYKAIKKRRSIRDFSDEPLSNEELDEVSKLLDEAGRYHDEISADAKLVKNGRLLQEDISGIIADYGKVEAPHYLVLTSEGEKKGLVEIGYRNEFVVLALTAMGVGTCWIGKGFNDEELKGHVEMPSDQFTGALIAFGPISDRKLQVIEEPKRKKLETFLLDREPNSLDKETLKVIDALRRAPSSINSQPWRLLVGKEKLHLYIGTRTVLARKLMKSLSDMNRIDAGIGLRHLEIAGNYVWGNVAVKEAEHPDKKGLEYVASIVK